LQLLPARFLLTVEAVLYLALQRDNRPIKLVEAIPAKSFSPRHLEATFQHLVRLGILNSIKGARGGYILGRPGKLISLADLYRASAGKSARQFRVADTPAHQTVSTMFGEIQSKWTADLTEISIQDLVDRAPQDL
jgi:Rrf2 family protein